MKAIYIERGLRDHPRAKAILARHRLPVVECEHYKDVFNPKQQNFRAQKEKPAMILARKTGQLVLPTPEGFGIGGEANYYFSHMLNCLYDCRYCFLQGFYPSANYVLFLNYEDFMDSIREHISAINKPSYFFSGYDCDSLAMEPVTGFLEHFLPFFRDEPKAILELRTKSTNVRGLLDVEPFDNCVVAFSFTPEAISLATEHRVPKLAKRLDAIAAVANAGWRVGLRLDPLIYIKDFEMHYSALIDVLMQRLQVDSIHSVSIGPMRFPDKIYQKITSLYPDDKLLAHPLEKRNKIFSYPEAIEIKMKSFVRETLSRYIPEDLIFECHSL